MKIIEIINGGGFGRVEKVVLVRDLQQLERFFSRLLRILPKRVSMLKIQRSSIDKSPMHP